MNTESTLGDDLIKNKFQGKLIVIILLFALIISIFPSFQSFEIQHDSLKQENKTKGRITIFKQIDPVGTYKDYMNGREDKPYLIQKISESLGRTTSPLVIIFVEVDIVLDLTDELILYNETLKNVGYDTVIYQVSGVIPEDLKDIIITYWQSGYNVTGTVLIGDLPVEWFHHENDFYGPSEFPCDLFLMDLDGIWTDTDGDEMYDSHTDGSGDTAPEIYVGRIDASNIPGDEITILKKYFAKVYNYWSGSTYQSKYGLTYTDEDWAYGSQFRYDLGYAYEDYEAIWHPDVDRDDYVNNRIPNTYEFIQLSCHSSSQGHSFSLGGWVSNNEIRDAPPKALFYNLFCCSSLRFTDYNCLGNAYILDTDTPSLTVIGSAKTGSMLSFRYFYEPIGNGSSFGTAFQKWFEYIYPYSDDPDGYNDISWFYGMTILGDPTFIINNKAPVKPVKPSGPLNGKVGVSYDYSSSTTDPNGNQIYYNFSWGDNTSSGWIGPYNSGQIVNTSHFWKAQGIYEIKVQARDFSDMSSNWSDSIIMRISNSNPPTAPDISGPAIGRPGKSYSYTFVSFDPDGDDIAEYIINWGNDNPNQIIFGPFASGAEVKESHTWPSKDIFVITIKAKDIYGTESNWTEFTVTMPRTKTINIFNQWLQNFLQSHPNLFPILRQLLNL